MVSLQNYKQRTHAPSILKLWLPLIFLVTFDHSSYSKY
jgi:hypothetical protein